MRSEHLAELNLASIALSPSEAAGKAQLDRAPARAVLLSIMDRPAYRFTGGGTVTVFADNGEVLDEVGEREAMKIASTFMDLPQAKLHYAGELTEPDQWTLGQQVSRSLQEYEADVARFGA